DQRDARHQHRDRCAALHGLVQVLLPGLARWAGSVPSRPPPSNTGRAAPENVTISNQPRLSLSDMAPTMLHQTATEVHMFKWSTSLRVLAAAVMLGALSGCPLDGTNLEYPESRSEAHRFLT